MQLKKNNVASERFLKLDLSSIRLLSIIVQKKKGSKYYCGTSKKKYYYGKEQTKKTRVRENMFLTIVKVEKGHMRL
jgi:hypothetical protein